jgi:hypothetical protein
MQGVHASVEMIVEGCKHCQMCELLEQRRSLELHAMATSQGTATSGALLRLLQVALQLLH